jgi:hypothetical protein
MRPGGACSTPASRWYYGRCNIDGGCRKEEGKSFTKEAAMAKYYSSVIAQKVSGAAIEWAGGVGFTRETGIEKYWRDSKIVNALSPYRWSAINSIFCRAQYTREPRISSCRRLPSSFRRIIRNASLCVAPGWTISFTILLSLLCPKLMHSCALVPNSDFPTRI